MLIGRHQSELETPALCLDLSELDQRVESLSTLVRESNQDWRPLASWHALPEISLRQVQGGAIGISLGTVAQADRFQERGLTAFHFTQPPIRLNQLQQLLAIAKSGTIRVSCDHYAQGEAISGFALKHGLRIPVLIDVNLGQHRAGIRPGLDARDLVRGLSGLPGVEIHGISADLGILPEDATQIRQQVRSADEIFTELRERMLRDGIRCDILSCGAEGLIRSVCESTVMSEIRTGNLFDFRDQRLEADSQMRPLIKIVARVISRSKLERAVLDFGRMHVAARTVDFDSLRVVQSALSRPLPDVQVSAIDWETTTLELGPQSRDLVIGDTVEVLPQDASLTLRQHRQVYGVREGIVESKWKLTD